MLPERFAYQDELETLAVFLGIILVIALFAWSSEPAPAPKVIEAPTPEPTAAPTPVETPTYEPTLNEPQKLAETGGLHLGEELSWQRDNASGYQKMSTHATVYGYRMFGTIDWRSPSWNQYFKMGAGEGMKYLFVFVNTYSDQNMTRMWGIQPDQFRVQVKDEVYEPTTELQPELRIKQFDDIWNLAHSENIKPYGYIRTNIDGRESTYSLGYIKAGKSNAWDGYIPFIVPATAQAKDIKILAQFNNLIEPHYWVLE